MIHQFHNPKSSQQTTHFTTLHLLTTVHFLISLDVIIQCTHKPSLPLPIALSTTPITTHLFTLKSPRYSRNWRSWQAPEPRLPYNQSKRQRTSAFVPATELKKSQIEVISCKATQMPHRTGQSLNKKLYKSHQPCFFTLTIATSGANPVPKNLVSASSLKNPTSIIERSRLPSAPNIN
jgi:hypothetical protein